ncbi:MAG TPA: hypothetical protein VFM88_13215, partial [Vicinamibacteria bacterium]|nr:hypothetical protein [Vicinamibacteria bacterium]
MTDRRPFEEPDSDEDVSRLLRLAGPRPDPPVEVAARVRAGALAAWRGELRARRRRRWLLALPAG